MGPDHSYRLMALKLRFPLLFFPMNPFPFLLSLVAPTKRRLPLLPPQAEATSPVTPVQRHLPVLPPPAEATSPVTPVNNRKFALQPTMQDGPRKWVGEFSVILCKLAIMIKSLLESQVITVQSSDVQRL